MRHPSRNALRRALSLRALYVKEDDDAFLTSTYSSPPKSSSLSAPISVTGTFDGGNVRFDRGSGACEDGEGGDADAVFLVASGGTVQ